MNGNNSYNELIMFRSVLLSSADSSQFGLSGFSTVHQKK